MRPTRTLARRRALATLAAATLVLSACGGDDATDTDTDTTDADAPEPDVDEPDLDEPEPEPDADADADAAAAEDEKDELVADEDADAEPADEPDADAAAGDLTAPGSELAFGEQAVVEHEASDADLVLGLTVTGIETGDLSDLEEAGFDVDDRMTGTVPHYVSLTVENLSDVSAGFASVTAQFALLHADGSQANLLSLIGSFEPCGGDSSFRDDGPGEAYETCRVYLVPEGVDGTAVQFRDHSGSTQDDPIVWS